MSKLFRILFLSMLFLVVLTGFAHAGVLGKVRSWITGEVMAFFLSGIIAVIGGISGIMFKKMIRTFKEAGEFMSTLGTALEDQRLTREELAGIVKEGRDIFAVWK
ncbi:MAG TPA: hypothetical protein ENH82_10225 [bacterium]|nr:hypothetical protein [bacterium]